MDFKQLQYICNMLYTIPITIVELEQDNYHIMVSGIFADKSIGHWIIDTGASKTVFDKALTDYYHLIDTEDGAEMQSAGLGVDYIETRVGEIKSLTFENFKVKNLRAALIDLGHINELYSKYSSKTIYGLLGSDFLMKYQAVIDYRKQLLMLKKD